MSLDGPGSLLEGKADDTVVNVCVIDIPGLFNLTSLMKEGPKAGFQVKIDYDQKKVLTKDTLRVVNLVADSIDIKKLKPNTYLIVPSLGLEQLPEPLMHKFRSRIELYFEQCKADTTGILARYLKSATNSINKVTNIEHSVQLSLNKVSRIAKSHKRVSQLDVGHVLKSLPTDPEADEGLVRLLLKEAERVRGETPPYFRVVRDRRPPDQHICGRVSKLTSLGFEHKKPYSYLDKGVNTPPA